MLALPPKILMPMLKPVGGQSLVMNLANRLLADMTRRGVVGGGPRPAFAGGGLPQSEGHHVGHPAHGPAHVQEIENMVKQFQGPQRPAEARPPERETPADGKGVTF